MLPSVTPTCSDAYSLGVVAGLLPYSGEQPCPRAGDSWIQGRTVRQEGSQQAQLLGSEGQVLSGSTWDIGSWRCWGLGHLLTWLLQHGTASAPAYATRNHEQTILASARHCPARLHHRLGCLSHCLLGLPQLYCCCWVPLTPIIQPTHSQLLQGNKIQL